MTAPEAGGKGVKYMGMNREESQDQRFSDLVVGRDSENAEMCLEALLSKVGGKISCRVLANMFVWKGSLSRSFLEDKRTPFLLLPARLPLASSVHL